MHGLITKALRLGLMIHKLIRALAQQVILHLLLSADLLQELFNRPANGSG